MSLGTINRTIKELSDAGDVSNGIITAEGKTALAAYLTAYIHATPGVRAVDRVSAAVTGRQFAFSCEIRTEDGTADVSFSLST